MALIVRNAKNDPVANAVAVAHNLAAQSTAQVSTFFHADSTSNGNVPDMGQFIPGIPGQSEPAQGSAVAQPGAQLGLFVTQSPAVDLLSGQQLALAIAGALIGSGQTTDPPAHFYDAPLNSPVSAGAHKAQDAVNTNLLGARNTFVAAGGAQSSGGASQGASNTFANAIQTAFNAHLTQTGVHYTNDGTNTSAAAVASSLGTFITLCNDLLNRVNNHVAHANPKWAQIRLIAE